MNAFVSSQSRWILGLSYLRRRPFFFLLFLCIADMTRVIRYGHAFFVFEWALAQPFVYCVCCGLRRFWCSASTRAVRPNNQF